MSSIRPEIVNIIEQKTKEAWIAGTLCPPPAIHLELRERQRFVAHAVALLVVCIECDASELLASYVEKYPRPSQEEAA